MVSAWIKDGAIFPVIHDRALTQVFKMFMIDLLDSLPRLRLSDDQIKAIIWVMKECGTPNVPSFGTLRRKQKLLTAEVNLAPTHHLSPLGNHFYMNHPAMLLALVRVYEALQPKSNCVCMSRTGQILLFAHISKYIPKLPLPSQNHGKLESGLTKWHLTISRPCGQIGKLLPIDIIT